MEEIKNNEDWTNMSEKQSEFAKMRSALKSIAREMQSYIDTNRQLESSTIKSTNTYEGEKVLSEILKCKTKIKCKKHCIQNLKKNLKTACYVAKTLAATKENQILKHNFNETHDKEKDTQKNDDLSIGNKLLSEKINILTNFICLGYTELQKIKHENVEEISVLEQLRKLIVSCGEYYADFCNERDKCLNLKQRNCFLLNKISFLEKYNKALSEQVRTLKCHNFGLFKPNNLYKFKNNKSKPCDNIEVAFAEIKMKTDSKQFNSNNGDNEFINKIPQDKVKKNFKSEQDCDLTSHLLIVKKLLSDQDTLLKDLKMLSQELRINTTDKYELDL